MTDTERALIEDYLSDNYLKSKNCVCKILKRDYISDADFDEYRGVVDEALVKAARGYDPSKGTQFATFAYLNISSGIKSLMTYKNRDCRMINKRSVSLDSLVDEEEDVYLKDIIIGSEGVNFQDMTRVNAYMAMLSKKAIKALAYRVRGYSWDDIGEKFDWSRQKLKNIMDEVQIKEYTNILRHDDDALYKTRKGA